MLKDNRPPIPDGVKREVRQRCGFGCVICGLPLYEYEHMLEWAKVKRHVADEITLLCRQHHGEKGGILPVATILEANKNPYNLRKGISKNILLHYSGNDVKVTISNNTFSFNGLPEGSSFYPLVIDHIAIIGFRVEDNKLLLNFIAFNELNTPILQIIDNELIYSTEQWDIEWIKQKLTIREGHRKILLQLIFEPPNIIRIAKGRILLNGIEVLIGANYIYCSNISHFSSGSNLINVPIGIAMGHPLPASILGVVLTGIPRYGFDRKEARKKLQKALIKMRADEEDTP